MKTQDALKEYFVSIVLPMSVCVRGDMEKCISMEERLKCNRC